MTPINEHTSGRDEARQALAESRQASRQADSLVAETRSVLERVRELHNANHFADKFRDVIQGARP